MCLEQAGLDSRGDFPIANAAVASRRDKFATVRMKCDRVDVTRVALARRYECPGRGVPHLRGAVLRRGCHTCPVATPCNVRQTVVVSLDSTGHGSSRRIEEAEIAFLIVKRNR